MKYFFECDAGMSGTDHIDWFEADPEQAEAIAQELALEWASSYFDVISEDMSDDYDQDEHGISWIYEYEVGYSVEEYDPEKHDNMF